MRSITSAAAGRPPRPGEARKLRWLPETAAEDVEESSASTAWELRVWAVHPGRLRTSRAAADADTEPEVAANRLADWLDAVDGEADCFLYDLMGGGVIPW